MKRYYIIVSGDVQGVGFRWYARRLAASYGVAGWVRNTDDGRVEMAAEGNGEVVDRFVVSLKEGSLGGNISELKTIEEPARGEPGGFRIVP